MKVKSIIFAVLLMPLFVQGQDMSGKWNGTLTQITAYNMAMDITQTGKILSGISKFGDGAGNFVEEKFSGIVSGSAVTINETEITKCPADLICCLKRMTGEFRLDSVKKELIIEGTWTSSKIYKNKEYMDATPSYGKFSIACPVQLIPRVVKQGPIPFSRPLDGYYKKTNIMNAKVTPYAPLREADVVYSRRVWREIDVREKMNQYLVSPKQRLIDILMDAVAAGELTAYDPTPTKEDPDGDAFGAPLTPEKAKLSMADSVSVPIIDKTTGDKKGTRMVAGEFNPDSVLKFRIKEDWIFDKQRSVEEVRIVGIAPLIKRQVAGADIQGLDYQPAFWIYFPAARQVLVTKEAVNSRNDATGLSFDDVFTKRIFTSYIVKQSNDKDEKIKDTKQGIDRLYESDRIKKTLLDWELNLWQY